MIDADPADRPALAATVHDPHGHFLDGLRRLADPLREVFHGIGVLATTATSNAVVSFLENELGAAVGRAEPAAERIGTHRREAVRLATTFEPSVVLHADLDHALRWIETDPAELRQHLAELPADFVVIGRTQRAMDACPRRLRDTEAIVNHVYRLATGRAWDLMFATRAMSRKAAAVIVEHGAEDSIANDVEWPFVAERMGLSVAYREAHGLSYRITADFDTDADRHDDDPLAWVTRVELANLHVQTLKRLLITG
ncbi:hypothetical protein [Flindersiella endophytica]